MILASPGYSPHVATSDQLRNPFRGRDFTSRRPQDGKTIGEIGVASYVVRDDLTKIVGRQADPAENTHQGDLSGKPTPNDVQPSLDYLR